MFADDTKIWAKITVLEDAGSLQEDLNRLVQWSEKWLLKFNPDKCKVMHIGHDLSTGYTMKEGDKIIELTSTEEENDIGVFITKEVQ